MLSATDGKALLQAYQVPVPRMAEKSWRVHAIGPTASVRAEMEAVRKLVGDHEDGVSVLASMISGAAIEDTPLVVLDNPPPNLALNPR